MASVSARHEGDLDGQLVSIDHAASVAVAIKIDAEVAHRTDVQHAAWMTLNMLCRLEKIVESVWVDCPSGVELTGRINPLAPSAGTLASALVSGASQIRVVPVHLVMTLPERAILLTIGPGAAVQKGWRVHGEAWWGGIARSTPIASLATSALSFGPYIAACLAVAEIFKVARVLPEHYAPVERAFYSTWSHVASVEPDPSGPKTLKGLRIAWALAGVGAVGAACLHTLWACPEVYAEMFLADSDEDGIDETNLNRYLLFGRDDVGRRKASLAASRLSGGDFAITARDQPFETASIPKHSVLCAVDTKPARVAVQSVYPTRLLMASTKDLRVELVRCDPRVAGPCARCYNAEPGRPSENVLRKRVQQMSDEERRQVVAAAGVSDADAQEWVETGQCGVAGERVRDVLLAGVDPALFSVPFVSCAAGTLLAAEACKEALGAPTPLSPRLSRATLQFWNPSAPSNGAGPYQRDPECPMCLPGTIATAAWARRCEGAEWRGDQPNRELNCQGD